MYWRVSYILYTYDLHHNFGRAPTVEKFAPLPQLIFRNSNTADRQRMRDFSASRGVPAYIPAFAGTRCIYPERDGQTELTQSTVIHLSINQPWPALITFIDATNDAND